MKDMYLKIAPGGGMHSDFEGFKANLAPSWRAQEAPKSRPEPQKIDVKKQHVFDIDFFYRSDLVLEGFFVGFLDRKCMKIAKTRF